MDCRSVDKLMDAFLDRELDASTASELSLHLATCDACRQQWGGLLTLLHRPAEVQVPFGLRDRLMARLDERFDADREAARGPVRQSRRLVGWVRYMGALAACLSLFVSGWMLSGWWTASHRQPVAVIDSLEASRNVVVASPWLVSAMAQTASMPGPISPAITLAQFVIPETLVVPTRPPEPNVRVYCRPATQPSSSPSVAPADPQMPMLPIIPRYLGA